MQFDPVTQQSQSDLSLARHPDLEFGYNPSLKRNIFQFFWWALT